MSQSIISTNRRSNGRLFQSRLQLNLALVLLALAVSLLSLGTGAAGVSPKFLISAALGYEELTLRDRVVLFDIRLPRLAMGFLIGAALAIAGALMQGLFRNPLADPGITGVGAGAGLGAVISIVLGGLLPVSIGAIAGPYLTSIAAFIGGWGATLVLYHIATREGQTNVATMLLAGIALGALAGAITGVMVFLADDQQLRDLTFWGMGSLAGATWSKVLIATTMIVPLIVLAPRLAFGLNAMSMGEAQALHVGIDVQRLKSRTILGTAMGAGIATALAGGIGFVGLVVPHFLRLVAGPDNRTILPAAAILGGTLLVAADMIARTIAAPAEMPIGVIMALIGAPVFLWILLRQRGLSGV